MSDDCPLCKAGFPLVGPRTRNNASSAMYQGPIMLDKAGIMWVSLELSEKEIEERLKASMVKP